MKADFARKKLQEKLKMKYDQEAQNSKRGIKWDVDFQIMVENERSKVVPPSTHKIPDLSRINIWVRKRPLFQREATKGDLDVVSCPNPAILVHKCKKKVDGVTKYIENVGFEFDNTFSEYESSESLYFSSIQPQIDFLFDGGIVTCFAYGQTGAGKTFTMEGVQKLVINDFFAGAEIMKEEVGLLYTFTVTYYEIYNGKVFDLFDSHKEKKVQESRSKQIKIPGLKEVQAKTAEEMTHLIEYGLSERKTKSTACNDTSSRSHAIGTIHIKQVDTENRVICESGKLLLVDLAGSEKAHDSQSNNKSRRTEGAEINTSLLSLKECIRAMESEKTHIPFRRSKLTMVLRDSFTGGLEKSRAIMIACIAPNTSSTEHTLNTLRYAERLKSSISSTNVTTEYMNNESSNLVQEPQQYFEDPQSKSYYDKEIGSIFPENFKESDEVNRKYSHDSNYSSQRMPEEQGRRITNNAREDSYSYFELNPVTAKESARLPREEFSLVSNENSKVISPERKSSLNTNFQYTKIKGSDTGSQRHISSGMGLRRRRYKHNFTQENDTTSDVLKSQELDSSAFNHFSSKQPGIKEESEDDIMQIESDQSNNINSTMEKYSAVNRGSCKDRSLLLGVPTSLSGKEMKHSRSSGKLNRFEVAKANRISYRKESVLQASTSSIPQGSYLIRKKPSEKVEVKVSVPKKYKLELKRKSVTQTPVVSKTKPRYMRRRGHLMQSHNVSRLQNLIGNKEYEGAKK